MKKVKLIVMFLALAFSFAIVNKNHYSYCKDNPESLIERQTDITSSSEKLTNIQEYKNAVKANNPGISDIELAKRIRKVVGEDPDVYEAMPEDVLLQSLKYMEVINEVEYQDVDEEGENTVLDEESVRLLSLPSPSDTTDHGVVKVTISTKRIQGDTVHNEDFFLVSGTADWIVIPDYEERLVDKLIIGCGGQTYSRGGYYASVSYGYKCTSFLQILTEVSVMHDHPYNVYTYTTNESNDFISANLSLGNGLEVEAKLIYNHGYIYVRDLLFGIETHYVHHNKLTIYGEYTVALNSSNSRANARAAYVHQYKKCTIEPSISVGFPASISISFSPTINNKANVYSSGLIDLEYKRCYDDIHVNGHEIINANEREHGYYCTQCNEYDYYENHSHDTIEYVNNEYHHKICLCGDVIKETHQMQIDPTYTNPNNHKMVCECGYTEYLEHNYISDGYDEHGHYYKCLEEGCTHQYEEEHHLSHVPIDDSRHQVICTDCDYSKIESHNKTCHEHDEHQHITRCSDCNHESYEKHYLTHMDKGEYHTVKCIICEYNDVENHHYNYVINEHGSGHIVGECWNCNHTEVLDYEGNTEVIWEGYRIITVGSIIDIVENINISQDDVLIVKVGYNVLFALTYSDGLYRGSTFDYGGREYDENFVELLLYFEINIEERYIECKVFNKFEGRYATEYYVYENLDFDIKYIGIYRREDE